jgi:iron complex transport system substrate-binding protein
MTRVVSLLPAGTEIVATLGAATSLVGISHECDYPAEVLGLPRVTANANRLGLAQWEDRRRGARAGPAGRPVVGVNAEQIRRLAPDLVISQTLCEVCAVADGEVHRLVNVLSPAPVSSRSMRRPGRNLERHRRGRRRAGPQGRGAGAEPRSSVPAAPAGAAEREFPAARVLTIEWLDPLFTRATGSRS